MSKEYQIRIQVVTTADDAGTNAATVSASTVTSRLVTVNEVFSPATINFVFDASHDFLHVNSTLLNRDLTPLELPNVGDDQWDHEPLVDTETHSKARSDFAKQFPRKLVVFFRKRKELEQADNGNWQIVDKGGSSSGSKAHYVNMSNSSSATDLAHEIGHYLQLPHTFATGIATVADAAAKIKAYVENGHDRADGLDALDGDRAVVLDSPSDGKGEIFVSEGLDKCGPVGEIAIPVNFGDETRTYTLKPNRNLIMSYFKGCSETGPKTISAEQARRVRDGLELRLRHALIGVKASPLHRLAKGATETAGAIGDLDSALVRSGRLVTAVRAGGKLKVIAWDISDDGNTITRYGDALAGDVKKLSVCGIGGNMVATAVITASDQMKVIRWQMKNGQVLRRGDITLDGTVTDLACCSARYDLGANHLATAVRRTDGTLRVDVWQSYANGSIVHRATASAGNINAIRTGVSTPRLNICEAGGQSLITFVRNDSGNLKPILWKFADDQLTRQESTAISIPSVGKIVGCNLTRELAVAAIEDEDKKLKLLAYGLPDDAEFIQSLGSIAAGGISEVEICRLGSEMVLTAVKISADTLKMILWQVTPSGQFVRLDDITSTQIFSRFSLCNTNHHEAAVSMQDGDGNLKIVVFRIANKLMVDPGLDVFHSLLSNAKPVPHSHAVEGGCSEH